MVLMVTLGLNCTSVLVKDFVQCRGDFIIASIPAAGEVTDKVEFVSQRPGIHGHEEGQNRMKKS